MFPGVFDAKDAGKPEPVPEHRSAVPSQLPHETGNFPLLVWERNQLPNFKEISAENPPLKQCRQRYVAARASFQSISAPSAEKFHRWVPVNSWDYVPRQAENRRSAASRASSITNQELLPITLRPSFQPTRISRSENAEMALFMNSPIYRETSFGVHRTWP